MDGKFNNTLTFGQFGMGLALGQSLLLGMYWSNPDNDSIVLYRGTGPVEDIDWTTPIGGRIGSGAITVVFTHTNELDYWYGVRQINCFGREELGVNATTFFRLDTNGAADYTAPDHITGLVATPKAGGVIKLSWVFMKFDGTAPTKFNVYSDGGLGVATLGDSGSRTLVGTVTYSAAKREYSLNTGALTGGQQYWFMVQAEDTNGYEDHYNLVVTATADNTGHDTLTGLEIGAVY
jgi:hypothetical protein